MLLVLKQEHVCTPFNTQHFQRVESHPFANCISARIYCFINSLVQFSLHSWSIPLSFVYYVCIHPYVPICIIETYIYVFFFISMIHRDNYWFMKHFLYQEIKYRAHHFQLFRVHFVQSTAATCMSIAIVGTGRPSRPNIDKMQRLI